MAPIDAVLPIIERDIGRARLLFESLAQNFRGLGTLWLICPDGSLDRMNELVASSRYGFELRVLRESRVVPEFALAPRLGGWYRQQLIKLAMFEHVQSELYLTLDADVVCTRPLDVNELCAGGRGACYVIQEDLRPHWYERVEKVLRLPARRGVMHNVTPALLHRAAMSELARHLNEKFERREFSSGWRGWKQRWQLLNSKFHPRAFAPWRQYLIGATPWTEYALYYSFLEATGRFEQYHQYTPHCIYDIPNSLWSASEPANDLSKWDPSAAFVGAGPPWFLVVQSNTHVSVDAVRAKIEPLLRPPGTRSA